MSRTTARATTPTTSTTRAVPAPRDAPAPVVAWDEVRTHLVTVARRRLSDPGAVEDVVQDVLLRLVRSGWSADDVESVPAWLTRVAQNAVVDHLRAGGRVRPVGVDEQLLVPPEVGSAEPDAALVTLAHGLAAMVDALPAPYAQAVRLVDLEGMTHAAVAGRTGLSVSGVKSRVQRGRALLARAVLECCEVDRDVRGSIVDWRSRAPAASCCA